MTVLGRFQSDAGEAVVQTILGIAETWFVMTRRFVDSGRLFCGYVGTHAVEFIPCVSASDSE